MRNPRYGIAKKATTPTWQRKLMTPPAYATQHRPHKITAPLQAVWQTDRPSPAVDAHHPSTSCKRSTSDQPRHEMLKRERQHAIGRCRCNHLADIVLIVPTNPGTQAKERKPLPN